MLATEPTDNTEASEAAEPMDRIEPADPMDKMEPADPIDRIDPDEPMLRIDPDEPASPAAEPSLIAMRPLCRNGYRHRRLHRAAAADRRGYAAASGPLTLRPGLSAAGIGQ